MKLYFILFHIFLQFINWMINHHLMKMEFLYILRYAIYHMELWNRMEYILWMMDKHLDYLFLKRQKRIY